MRLLKLEPGSQPLSFTKDLVSDIPPYAILSHTSGDDDEELTYKDIKKGQREGQRQLQEDSVQCQADFIGRFLVSLDRHVLHQTGQAIPSFNKLSTPCFASIKSRPSAMSTRLREAIAMRSNRLRPMASILKAYLVLPFGRNVDFVGREDILGELTKKISPAANGNPYQMTVIEGLGGVGKTQVALEAAYRVHEKDRHCSNFGVPAVGQTTIDNAYRKIGQSMRIPNINDSEAEVRALVKDCLSKDDARQWLLVIDNADDIDLMFSQGDQPSLYDFVPSNPKGSVLFATRNHEATVSLNVCRDIILCIEEINQNEAIQLLQKKLTDAQLRDVESTPRLLEFLAHLPLAIRQASAYMLRTGILTSTYLGYCESSDAASITSLASISKIEVDTNTTSLPTPSLRLGSFPSTTLRKFNDLVTLRPCMFVLQSRSRYDKYHLKLPRTILCSVCDICPI
ncbi:hypothetical protein QQS21_012309 [Conoideocrella luteorostrata]|uniref:NB-ARC domain-containing protein n=1 Tax=Conoideocrella luteorostrata TaxID=1105319 RepID=A0AAJ0CBQ1_9HYPO|nr:hypothetical protein QQS21_012309 [Conoideocrella luteorostrata]